MSRYIDADHLRKWILSWWERTEPTSEFLKGGDILNQIDREPSIDIPQWISCSERLPKIGEVVLVTWEWGCKKYITIAYMVTIRGVTYWDSKLQHEFEPLNVLAWMPLPKPYKERSK